MIYRTSPTSSTATVLSDELNCRGCAGSTTYREKGSDKSGNSDSIHSTHGETPFTGSNSQNPQHRLFREPLSCRTAPDGSRDRDDWCPAPGLRISTGRDRFSHSFGSPTFCSNFTEKSWKSVKRCRR